MTCIVGIVDESADCVWMASDSGSWNTADETTDLVPYTKLFGTGNEAVPIVVGFTGNLRMCQVLQHAVLPHITEVPWHDSVIERWVVLTFRSLVHDAFVEHDVLKDGEPFHMEHSGFMLAIGKRLFSVSEKFEVVAALRGYEAMGSGRLLALGSVFTSNITEPPSPQMKLYRALSAAKEHLPEIKEPFLALNTRTRNYYELGATYGG
jgi:hypothetical protein